MKVLSLLIAAVGAFTTVDAVVNTTITTNPTAIKTIRFRAIKPFARPEPVTDAQKAAVKFKPQLTISNGCHPYPAVDADGSISKGLKWGSYVGCSEMSDNPQVFARTSEFEDKLAIIYAWYFPKAAVLFRNGHRHQWLWAVVWVDPLDAESTEVLGVSVPGFDDYEKHAPVKAKYVDGTTVKLDSYKRGLLADRQALRLTKQKAISKTSFNGTSSQSRLGML